jgi:hypothetical protein
MFYDLRKAYALPDGELIRCVPAPFPPVRETWLKALRLPVEETQVLTWQGDRLELYDHLPRAADALPLRNLLVLLFRVPTWNVVDDQNLLAGRNVQADFVIRSEGWNEAKALDQLGAALRRDLKVPVKLSVRTIERPHVVASGSMQAPMLPGLSVELPVAVYGKEPPPPKTPERPVALDGLLLAVGDYVGLAVINEVEQGLFGGGRGGRGRNRAGPRGGFFPGAPGTPEGGGDPQVVVPGRMGSQPWSGRPAFDAFGGQMQRGGGELRVVVQGDRQREGVDVETVLKRVTEQTGLTLRVEKRSVRALVVEKAE